MNMHKFKSTGAHNTNLPTGADNTSSVENSCIHSPVQSDGGKEALNATKQYSQIVSQTIDRFTYKRAYGDKKKLRYESEVAEKILAALAKEASGQETN